MKLHTTAPPRRRQSEGTAILDMACMQKREKAERPSVNRSVSRTLSCSRFPANQTERRSVRQDRQPDRIARQLSWWSSSVVCPHWLPRAPDRSLSLSTLSCSLHVSADSDTKILVLNIHCAAPTCQSTMVLSSVLSIIKLDPKLGARTGFFARTSTPTWPTATPRHSLRSGQ